MGFAGSERPAPWRVGGAISSLPAFLASLGILVKLTSAACSPRLDGAVSKRSWAGEVRNVSLLVAIGSRPRAIATRPDLERAHRGARSSISLSPAMAPRTSGFTTRYLSGDHVRHLLRD
jgi:hypothetical protein